MSDLTPTKWCGAFSHSWRAGYVGYRKRNGLLAAAQECSRCPTVSVVPGVKMSQRDIAQLPLKRDRTNEVPLCIRCGAVGTELHHWAPRAVFGFDDAETWPQDYLCRPCHVQWHGGMTGKSGT